MRKVTVIMVLLLVAMVVSAAAQEFPRVTGFMGYSYAREQYTGATAKNSKGFNGSAVINANNYFGFVADVSGHYHTDSDTKIGGNVYHFLFGPQFTYRNGNSRTVPFGRVMFGASKASTGYGASLATGNGLTTPETEWTYAFGGGMDVKLSNTVAIRAFQADYIRTHFVRYKQSNVRLSFGLVFNVGGK